MTLAESEKTPERSPESAQLDEAAIRRLQDDLPDDEVLYDLAELFRVFGDSTRIKILYALFESELYSRVSSASTILPRSWASPRVPSATSCGC